MKLSISQQDILRSKTVTPGWYMAVLKSVEDTTASSTGVAGTKVTFIIEQDGPFKGVPVDTRFWENAPGFASNLVAVLTEKKQAEPGEYDLSRGIGKKMRIYVTNGKWQNRLTNQIEDYQPTGN